MYIYFPSRSVRTGRCLPRRDRPDVIARPRYAGHRPHEHGDSVYRRVLRVVISITLGLAVMGLVAYAVGRVMRTEWVWWLAPLTVVVDCSLLFGPRVSGSAALVSPRGPRTSPDSDTPLYLLSAVVAVGLAAWGAYVGNRPAIIIGAASAIFGRAFECREGLATAPSPSPNTIRATHSGLRGGVSSA
jgi:hypothetical protein